MKIKQLRLLIIITFATFSAAGSLAQNVPEVGYFNASAADGKVYLSWQLKAGATCLGTKIQRSGDGQSFTEIGKIEGVCGDLTKPESYSFIDENPPLNQQIYYRLELGFANFTDTIYLEVIDLAEDAYQVRPNPAIENTKIYFTNGSKEQHTLMLTDLSGKLLHTRSTNQSVFELTHLPYSPGIYLFTIRSEDGRKTFSGKLVIAR